MTKKRAIATLSVLSICMVLVLSNLMFVIAGDGEQAGVFLKNRSSITGASNEKWILENVSGNNYRIKNKATNLYLTEDASKLIQATLSSDNTQVWEFNDHYGVTRFKIKNVATNNWLTCFNEIRLGEEDGGGGGMVSLAVSDLNSPLESFSDLAEGEYYLYNSYFTGEGPNENAPCVIVGESVEDIKATPKLIQRSEVDNLPSQKWILENVEGTKYKIKNKFSALYLTDRSGSLILASQTNDSTQVWEFNDHYGVTRFKIKNVATNNWLTCFNEIKLGEEKGGGDGMVSLAVSDLNSPLASFDDLAEGEYYLYNSYFTGEGPNENAPCVIVGSTEKEPEEDPDDSLLGGDPDEKFTLDQNNFYEMTVKKYELADGSASQKWYFEEVEGEQGRWRIKNKASGMYITQINDEIVQQAFSEENTQKWQLDDTYGLRYSFINLATGKGLRLDSGTKPRPSEVDRSNESLIAIQQYASRLKHPSVLSSATPKAGVEYYIFNWAFEGEVEGVRKGGILVAIQTKANPGEVVKDEPMPDQDIANEPIEADGAVSVKLVPISSADKIGSQIWIFRKVAIDPTLSVLEAMKFDIIGLLTEYPEKITFGFTVQNKETGLFLTDSGASLVQMAENNSKDQIWMIEDYPLPYDQPQIKIMRNYGSGRQLEIGGTIPGLYNPNNYDKETDTEWPELNKQYGGPVAGISTVAFARVVSDMTVNDNFPQDGKGYYIYCGGHGRSSSLLEAEGGRVPSQISEIPEKATWKKYKKDFTYKIDFEKEIDSDNPDWDLLYGGEILGGALGGQPLGETNSYGLAFRHKTSGMGVNKIKFSLMIPEVSTGKASIALRQNDYHDTEWQQTGMRLYIDKDGRIGLKYAGSSTSVTWRETGFDFYEHRIIYIEDDTDKDIISVYFNDDNAKSVLVATISLKDGIVILKPTASSGQATVKLATLSTQTELNREFGYNFYGDGFISLSIIEAYDAEIDDLSITIPRYSTIEFPKTDDGEDPAKKPEIPKTGNVKIPSAFVFAVATSGATLYIVKGKKRKYPKK